MHSSWMRTSRSLTVCRSLLPGGVSLAGGGIPACTVADPPPVNRMTDRCKNITLATTSLRPVIKVLETPVLCTCWLWYSAIFTPVRVSVHIHYHRSSTDMAEFRDEPDAKRRKLAASASGSGCKAQSSVSSQQFQAGKCRQLDSLKKLYHQNPSS